MLELKTGDLAYFDSFLGAIPCRVERIEGTSGLASTAQKVTIKLTASRSRCSDSSIYRVGEVIESNGLHVFPRDAHRKSKYGNRIRPYQVIAD